MLVKDIFNLRISVKKDSTSKVIKNVRILDAIVTIPDIYKDKLIKIRNLPYHSEEQSELKKKVPFFCFAGEVRVGDYINDKSIIRHTNLITIDIDKKDNSIDLTNIRKRLLSEESVVGVYQSVSGEGLWVLMLVEDWRYTTDYINYIYKLWKQKYNIIIDSKANNISRQRVISYNIDWKEYTKPFDYNIIPWSLYDIPFMSPTHQIDLFTNTSYNKQNDFDKFKESITVCANNGWYAEHDSEWWYLSGECAILGDIEGFKLFEQFSNNHPVYKDSLKKISDKYNKHPLTQLDGNITGKWINRAKKYNNKNDN